VTAGHEQRLLRIERAEGALLVARARAAPSADVHARDLGGPVAIATLDRANTLFNRAIGLGPDDGERVAVIAAFYAQLGVPPRIDVCPALRSDALGESLRAAGLAPGGFPFFSRRVLFGRPNVVQTVEAPLGVTIERAGDSASEAEAFVSILESAWPVGDAARQRALAEARSPQDARQRRYFAAIDGKRVAIAGLELCEGVAYLNLAVTLEPYRGRGCQSVLIQHRLADAAKAGADIAFSLVAPDSQSERNLRRAGLDDAYDRELWLPPDWTQHPFYRDAAE
jgi:GNAT superfamily N-acetyltransferase